MVFYPVSKAFVGVATITIVVTVALIIVRHNQRASSQKMSAQERLERARRNIGGMLPTRRRSSGHQPMPKQDGAESNTGATIPDDEDGIDADEAAFDAVFRSVWSDPGGESFKVRGNDYLSGGRKIQSKAAAFELVHSELLETPGGPAFVVAREDPRVRRCVESLSRPVLILNVQIPGEPPVSIVSIWQLREGLDIPAPEDPAPTCSSSEEERFLGLLSTFWHGDDDFRNARCKLIPTIVEGPLVVRSLVGSKPALIGRKLTQRYTQEDHWFEIDLDISSSSVASAIVSVCRGAAQKLTVDMGLTIQGESTAELPERVMCCVRLAKMDMDMRKPPLP